MTIEELENTLPNGFHDSYLVSVAVDFISGTCSIYLDVDFDDPEQPALPAPVFRRMKLHLTGLRLFIFEPPDVRIPFSGGETVWASGYSTTEKILPNLESYRKTAPSGTFFYSFFLSYYNSFIHLAATEAELAQ